MSSQYLGRLQQVDLRNIWNSESRDFTPWLAHADNLKLLGDSLDIELELIDQECSVGEFRADIRCRDLSDGHIVLIENQLERTDHDHLGKLLTYAAGIDAITIIWVASRFADPHRAALDWLNEVTNESVNFFGLEVELWRIGDSAPAPKFNIVSKPNDWSKSVNRVARQSGSGVTTDLRRTQVEFWTDFRAYLVDQRSSLKPQSPRPQHWLTLAIGRSGYNLAALFIANKKRIGVEYYVGTDFAHRIMDRLENERADIESELGVSSQWIRAKKQARIAIYKDADEPLNRDTWPDMFAWLSDALVRFDAVFRSRTRALPDLSGEIDVD